MGTTSSIKSSLFGDVNHFSQLLMGPAKDLASRYDNRHFQELFRSLPHRSITVGPMSMASRLAKDLGCDISENILVALGVLCFHISTHDDLIDEPPHGRAEKAALLYAGNISLIEGMKMLQRELDSEQVVFILRQVERNHLLQQVCVETLWDDCPRDLKEYEKGIQHIGSLIGIGVCTALAVTHNEDLWADLENICADYGAGLQLLDDINEAHEDEKAGYTSYPVLEGAPYESSFKMIDECLDKADALLDQRYIHFRELLLNVQIVKKRIENHGY